MHANEIRGAKPYTHELCAELLNDLVSPFYDIVQPFPVWSDCLLVS